PRRATLLSSKTTSVPVAVYVPTATLTVSPSTALPIAPLIVRQGAAALAQVFRSLPVVATYQAPASTRLPCAEAGCTPPTDNVIVNITMLETNKYINLRPMNTVSSYGLFTESLQRT